MSLGETTIAITAARNVQVKQHLSIGSGIKSRPAAASLKKQPNSAPQKHDVHVCVCVCVCVCVRVCVAILSVSWGLQLFSSLCCQNDIPQN